MRCKALVGYALADGVTPDEYDAWLWDVHVPDLLANPHLDRLVFDTVVETVTSTSGGAAEVQATVPLYRVAELHFADRSAYAAYRAWFDEHPIPPERGPAGRSDFRFYVVCDVVEAAR